MRIARFGSLLSSRRITTLALLSLLAACGGGGGGGGSPGAGRSTTASSDTTPPIVNLVTPSNNATGVGLGTTVSVNFSEAMDCTTVTATTFKLSAGGNVAASVSCGGTTATLTPSAALATSTLYTVTVTTGAKDAAGNALASQFTSSFTTTSTAPTTSYTVGGTLSTLAGGTSVVLQNNGANNLTLSANGPFTFSGTVSTGAAYNVTVLTQPSGQYCSVANGTGTMGSANVANVAVSCVFTYTVGGTISGLAAGQNVVLKNNTTDILTVSSNGTYSFANALPNGSGYNVTVQTQPTGQICTVTNGTGTLSGANVTNVGVSCAANVPSAPTGVSATGGNNQVTVSWTAASGATGYNVYRSTTIGFTPAAGNKLTASPATSIPYLDSSAVNGTLYYYRVTAVNANGESAASAEVSATPSAGGGANSWTGKASMSLARADAAVAAVNGVLYVAGGNGGGGATATLQAYDPVSNTWTSRAAMPGGSYQGAGAVEINGKLYVAGGWSGSVPINNLYIYDPAANSWTSGANLPTLSGCGASGAIDGKLYVTTPCNGFSGYTALLHVYDPASNAWTPLANSNQVHANAAYGVINGKLYVAGGLNGPADAVGPWSVAGVTEVYDPVANGWTTLAPMPTPVQEAASAVYNGKLYVIGGLNAASSAITTVQVYDPVANSWSTVSATALSSALAGARGATVNGIVYAAGGSSTGAAGTGLLAYTPAANAGANNWASKAPMPTARFGTTASEINGFIYVPGGYTYSGTGIPSNALERYDPVANTWNNFTIPNMANARGNLGSATVNGKLYVLGGDNWVCSPYSANEEYNPATNTWASKAAMPTARTSFATAVVNGILYTIGGTAYCGTDYSVVEAYDPVANSWTTKAPLPRTARNLGAGVVNGIVYVVTGGGNAGELTHVLAYDPQANAWTPKAAIPNAATMQAGTPAVFTINGIIHTAGGDNSGVLVQAYDPLSDSWSTKTSLPAGVIWGVGGASANGVGYAIGGWSPGASATPANQAYTP